MTIDIAVGDVIERPSDEVAAFAIEPANAHRWIGHVEQAYWTTGPPTRLGSRIAFDTTSRAGSGSDEYEIYEWEPGERVAMKTVDARVPLTLTYEWRPVGGRATHMTLRYFNDGTGIARLVAPITRAVMRRSMVADLGRLRKLLESQRR